MRGNVSHLDLLEYFIDGVATTWTDSVGMEIETSFVDATGRPATLGQTQGMLHDLRQRQGWQVHQTKGALITTLVNNRGDRLQYELGRQNLECSLCPVGAADVVPAARKMLQELYGVGALHAVRPYFQPVLATDEDLLIIPDERDATWLQLDGRAALAPLATITAVQFTVGITPDQAISALNRLGGAIDDFLRDYPQEVIWRRYIADSHARYHPLRYGGPLNFSSLDHYCQRLTEMDVIQGGQLVPFMDASPLNVSLFLRSVWWYFRLRRYGDQLCIEVRPLSRRDDTMFQSQLDMVLGLVRG